MISRARPALHCDIGDGLGSAPTSGIVDTQLVQTADFEEVKRSIKLVADLADDFEKNSLVTTAWQTRPESGGSGRTD